MEAQPTCADSTNLSPTLENAKIRSPRLEESKTNLPKFGKDSQLRKVSMLINAKNTYGSSCTFISSVMKWILGSKRLQD